MATYYVHAEWDDETGVWISRSNIPGLVIETDTLSEFEEVAAALAPDLLADNA